MSETLLLSSFPPLLSLRSLTVCAKLYALRRVWSDDCRRKPQLGFLLSFCDRVVLGGGACVSTGTSSWCREEGMLCHTGPSWDHSCKALAYILKDMSNLYLFKDVLAKFRNYPEDYKRVFFYPKPTPDPFLVASVFEIFSLKSLFNKSQMRYFSLSSFINQLAEIKIL